MPTTHQMCVALSRAYREHDALCAQGDINAAKDMQARIDDLRTELATHCWSTMDPERLRYIGEQLQKLQAGRSFTTTPS